MASYLCAKSGSDGLEYSTITVSLFLLPFLLSCMFTGQLAQDQRIHGSHAGNCLPACHLPVSRPLLAGDAPLFLEFSVSSIPLSVCNFY